MSTQQTQHPHQTLQQSPKEVESENSDTPAAAQLAQLSAPVTQSAPQASLSQPSNQICLALFYLFCQVALLGMALYNTKNFQVALGWIVLSLCFTQVMADFVQFTRPNLKKWAIGICTIFSGLIALSSSYLG